MRLFLKNHVPAKSCFTVHPFDRQAPSRGAEKVQTRDNSREKRLVTAVDPGLSESV